MSRAAAQGLGRFVQLANQQGLQTTSLLPAVGIAQQHIRSGGQACTKDLARSQEAWFCDLTAC